MIDLCRAAGGRVMRGDTNEMGSSNESRLQGY